MIAWETTFQIALRNCSKERGKIVLFIILGKRGMCGQKLTEALTEGCC